MDIQKVISETSTTLTQTFAKLDNWFERKENLRNYRPAMGGWTINEILEHIGITNHFLILLIDKAAAKALANNLKLDLPTEIQQQELHFEQIADLGRNRFIKWTRPEHMEPKGEKTSGQVRIQLKEQCAHCLGILHQLPNGEGLLYKTTMTVNNLGKLNVYEYIYFLTQHALRHIAQMELVEREYELITP